MLNSNKSTTDELGNALLRYTFNSIRAEACGMASVAIYGAGHAGQYLAAFLREAGKQPVGFLDDFCPTQEIDGLPVFGLEKGLACWNPSCIVLGTMVAGERMSKHLKGLGYRGKILLLRDVHAAQKKSYAMRSRVSARDLIQLFHNRHEGRRAFIIGNGPSLLKTDPRRLKNEITFACNNIFFLEGFEPSYYVAEDRVLTQDRADIINALPWIKFFPDVTAGWLDNGIFLRSDLRQWPETFSTDLMEGVEFGFTVTYMMLEIAFYMGCNPVYLIGVDHNYVVDEKQHTRVGTVLTSLKDDPNHFHPDYFGKGYRWHDPKVERMEASYRLAKTTWNTHGRSIYNATAGGRLEVFDRIDFETLIPKVGNS